MPPAPSTFDILDFSIKVLIAIIGAILAIAGGYFGVIFKIRLEKKDEIDFIKLGLLDELHNICSIVDKVIETFKVSPKIYPEHLNELAANNTNFNDHRKRIYLIKDDALRADIVKFYAKLNGNIIESRKKIQVVMTTTMVPNPNNPGQQIPVQTAQQPNYQPVIDMLKEVSEDSSKLQTRISAYKYKHSLLGF